MTVAAVRLPPWVRGTSPARRLWGLLTSVRFAIAIAGSLAAASLLGVVIPQMSERVRGNPALRQSFVDDHGPAWLAPWVDRMQLFQVFHSTWFLFLLGVLVVAISVCTVSRFRPIWRQVAHPVETVPERYFSSARHRADIPAGASFAGLAATLRRRGYRVKATSAETLYADRFRWSPLATFASHLSLLVFLLGAFVTLATSQRQEILVPEGQSRPVFAPGSDKHMQVELVSFHRELGADGRDTRLESDIRITRHGELVAEGTTSINRPLRYGGWVFHQSAFAEGGVAFQVVEAATGRVVFSDVVPLMRRVVVPSVTIRDRTGQVVFAGDVPPTAVLEDGTGIAAVNVGEDPAPYAVAARQSGSQQAWELAVSDPEGAITVVPMGEQGRVGAYTFAFQSVRDVRADFVSTSEDSAPLLLELLPGDAATIVTVTPDGDVMRLGEGETATAGGYTYRFVGTRSYSGITVRRDPGTSFIWIAGALLIGGLGATFYLPRRQVWARWRDGRLLLAGSARNADFAAELQRLGEAAARRSSPRGESASGPGLRPPALE